MTPKEIVKRTIKFQNPERVARSTGLPLGSDFESMWMSPSVDDRPNAKNGLSVDEWGAVWENIGVCTLGEVKEYPLKDWENFASLNIPDIESPHRWNDLSRQLANIDKSKFIMGYGIALYERVHFIRGLENTWTDIYLEPDNLRKLIDILTDMNIKAIARYGAAGADGFMFCDDWGLQNKLMISPDKWREFWKPAYAKVYKAAHDAGMLTFLHSCGYILEIMDDLIDAGLDVIQLDQQLNMGLDKLHQYAGKITFWCPVDIQAVMPHSSADEIRAYCHSMFRALATPHGGFIAGYYSSPVSVGHSEAAIAAMYDEYLKLDYREIKPL